MPPMKYQSSSGFKLEFICNVCSDACTDFGALRRHKEGTLEKNHISQCLQVFFPVRIHVCLQLHPSFACHFTILTSEHVVIMLCLNVHPQMFVRRSINAAYDTGRHGDCRFVLLTKVLDIKYYDFFLPKKKTYRF